MVSNARAVLEGHQYINLETFKKDGKGVVTPVWFMLDGDKVIVVTTSGTGKVKRLRNNNSVRIMPSGFRGEPRGTWLNGTAQFASAEQLKRAQELRSKKYGFKARLAGTFSRAKGSPVAILITLDQ